MPMNIQKLRTDLRTIAGQIREQKDILRESGQPRVGWSTYRDLSNLKETATLLCALRAHLRGRLHEPRKMDAEQQAALVAHLAAQYEEVPEAAQAA